MAQWVYRLADSVFLRGGCREFTYDPATEGVVDLDIFPDLNTERYDANSITKVRSATPEELGSNDTAILLAKATATSRQKDLLATCALIVRARNPPAWNAMTVAEKRAATFAEADLWRDIRTWAEANL